VSRTVYDQYGRVELTTDRFILPGSTLLGEGAAPARATRTLYDDQGRAHKSQRIAGAVVEIQSGASVVTTEGTVLSTSESLYNAKGQVARTIAADGQITDFEYDAKGRQTAVVTHPLPAEDVGLAGQYPGKFVRHRTEIEFNVYGQRFREWTNIVQVEDASGNVETINRTNARKTEFRYDEHSRLVKTIFDDGTSTETTYDVHDRAIAETDQLGHVKRFEYDGNSRLTAVILATVLHPESGLMVHPRYEYGYDAQGNHTHIRDNVQQKADGTIQYDHLAAPGDDVRDTVFTFDTQNRQLSRTLPLGTAQAYSLIQLGQDVRDLAGDPGAFTEGFWYNDRSQQTLHVSFEGVVAESSFDNTAGGQGRLQKKRYFDNLDQYAGGAGAPSEVWIYTHDAFGRLVEIVQDGDGNLTTTADQRLTSSTYDAESRLTRVATPEGTIHYVFNDVGQHIRTWTGADELSVQTDTRYTCRSRGVACKTKGWNSVRHRAQDCQDGL
ncbi:MAG: hypothetical protein KY475_10370, partial [Planctomycetes bacterium]|nr:hypothetical protein [Planctomycetota bacterium]